MKNLRIYILLLSATALITFIHNIQINRAIAQLIPSSNINENITNTEDLPILQSPIAKKVYDTAKSITVMIQGKSGDLVRIGSGVIIAKNGDTYYVLTAEHVFRGFSELEITTPDGKIYPIKINEQEARIGETDLGVLEFSSKENYQVASLASNRLEDRDIVFTYGFPREEIIKGNNRGLFSIGYLFSQETSIFQSNTTNIFSEGYELAYSNLTRPGTSGGAVLDHQGRLVGIHGRADGYYEFDEIGKGIEVYLGYSIGIPIGYLFGDLVKDENWKTYLQQDKGENSVLSTDSKNELLETVVKSLKAPTEDNAFAWVNYGNQLWRYREYRLARDAFEKAIGLKSDLYYAYYGKGLALYGLNKYEEVISILEKGINIYKRTGDRDKTFIITCLDWEGRSLQLLKKYEEALKVYEQAIQLIDGKEKNFNLFFQQSWLLQELKRYQDAILTYNETIKIKSNHPYSYNNRGTAYKSLKEYEKALSDYNQAIKLNPQDARFYHNRGNVYFVLQKYQQALADFTQAITIEPLFAQAYNDRGGVYVILGEKEKAITDIEKAKEIFCTQEGASCQENKGIPQ